MTNFVFSQHVLQAVLDFIAANASTCAAGDNTTSPAPDSASSCPAACNGHGACIDGQCACFSGFNGLDCNTSIYSEHYNCGYKCTFDSGFCNNTEVQGSERYWTCQCKAAYTGLTCAIPKCANNCSWSGTCLESNVCNCYPGFKGSACEVDCGCNGHGVCKADGTCACDAGWRVGPNGCEPECSSCAAGAGCIAPGECGCVPGCAWGTCYNGRCECWAGELCVLKCPAMTKAVSCTCSLRSSLINGLDKDLPP